MSRSEHVSFDISTFMAGSVGTAFAWTIHAHHGADRGGVGVSYFDDRDSQYIPSEPHSERQIERLQQRALRLLNRDETIEAIADGDLFVAADGFRFWHGNGLLVRTTDRMFFVSSSWSGSVQLGQTDVREPLSRSGQVVPLRRWRSLFGVSHADFLIGSICELPGNHPETT